MTVKKFSFLLFILVDAAVATAQTKISIADSNAFHIDSVLGYVDASVVRSMHYVRFGLNRIEVPGEKKDLMRFYQKFDSAKKFHDRQLVVYHFGGSHIQADFYSNRVRNYLQTFDTCMRGPRGWIFPFAAVGTNNPSNYKAEHTGVWKAVRSPVKKDSAKTLGLIGISGTTRDSVSTIKIYATPEQSPFQFTRLRVYCNVNETRYAVRWKENSAPDKTLIDDVNGFVEFDFTHPLDTINLLFEKNGRDTLSSFILYGMLLLNDEPGIVYNSIGVNGAGFDSYARCQLFEQQLAQLPPDLVIVSIGTNDANDADFSTKKFAENYIRFVENIQRVNPNCSFIFTVPNDNYYRYRYPQKNIAKCKAVIFSMATKFNAGVWDFYDIMGGYGSSQKWYRAHLMKRDRIHFTAEGYKIKGDLFYEAFLKGYAEFSFIRSQQTIRN